MKQHYKAKDGFKICPHCLKNKPVTEFYKPKRGNRSLCWCRKCMSDSAKEWRQKYPEKVKDSKLRAIYGITLDEFNALFEAQGRKCASCEATEPGAKWWHIDHDHDTRKIRGILCEPCNLTLGAARESLGRLQGCIYYLRYHKGLIIPPARTCKRLSAVPRGGFGQYKRKIRVQKQSDGGNKPYDGRISQNIQKPESRVCVGAGAGSGVAEG